jgi:hypothetical protein
VGLLVSLIGNYLQYRKNVSDEVVAKQQLEIAQQQATTAREELALKRTQLEGLLAAQAQAAQNCNQKRAEHDDALNAVHLYDQSITKNEARLESKKAQVAMAQNDHDNFRIAEHTNLVDLATDAIKSLTASRDEAMNRARDLERQCGF